MGQFANQFEAVFRTPEVGMDQAQVVVQPAKIVAHDGRGHGTLKSPQHGPDGPAERAVALGEKTRRVRARQPYQPPPQVCRRGAQGLQVGAGFFGGLRQALGFRVQHLDMGVRRHGW